MRRVFAFLPCYNELENIELIVADWNKMKEIIRILGYRLEIIGIDDKSTDDTLSKLKHMVNLYENVSVIEHKQNKGLGGVVSTAFSYFSEHGDTGDICFLMDGDNTHDPRFSESMICKMREGYDCVIASRYCRDSKIVGVPGFREFLSNGAKLYYMLILHVKGVKDYTCGYRLYTYEIIQKAERMFGNKLVERRSFACMMEVLYKLYVAGARFAEVPFELRYDKKGGESKMKIFRTVKDSLVTAAQLRICVKR